MDDYIDLDKDFDEISEKAFKHEELGEFKNLGQKYAYLQMLNLYKDFSMNKINKEETIKEKEKIKREYIHNILILEDYECCCKERNKIRGEYHDYIVAIEKSIAKDEMLDNSLKFIQEIIGDNTFYDRQFKKIDNE